MTLGRKPNVATRKSFAMSTSPNTTLPNPIEIAKRYKKTIILWPMLCLALGALFYYLCPRQYQSEARLFLRIGRESVGIDPAATTGQTMPLYTADRKDEVRSAQEIFKSRAVAAGVVDMIGPDVILGRDGEPKKDSVFGLITKPIGWVTGLIASIDPISDRESAIINVERSLAVGGEQQATMIVVKYAAENPQLAQKVCQAIVDVGQKEYMRVHRSAESKPFFTEQQNRLKDQLDGSLDALRTAKNEMGLSSVEQRRTTLESQYSAVELDRLSTSQQLATSQARIEELERQIADVPERLVGSTKTVPNQGADLLRSRLYELQVKSMELASRYNESHPLLMAVNDQLEEAKKVVAEQDEQRMESTDEVNPIHRQLSLEMKQEQGIVAGLQSRLGELEKQKAAVLGDLRALNEQDLKIDQLTREAELARDKYMQYARTMEETRIDVELQKENINNLSEAQAATLAEKPVNPSKMMTAAGTVSLAIGGLFGLVLLREAMHPPAVPENTAIAVFPPRRRLRRRRPLEKTNGHALTDDHPPLPK
jgi:uncharacterized protein involved in exopolysaccharide biosynthesis